MRVLYDHQTYSKQQAGGISRYFWELIHYFEKLDGLDVQLSLILSNNVYLNSKAISHINFFAKKKFKGRDRLIYALNQFISLKKVRSENFDLFHPTYYDDYFLKDIRKPFVVTVHDMIHEKLHKKYPMLRDERLIASKRALMSSSSKIIAVSESTKNDILEIYPEISDDKIKVIYHGNSLDPVKSEIQRKKEVLFVGDRKYYKNFGIFLTGCKYFIDQNREFEISVVGGGEFSAEENSLISSLDMKDHVVHYGRLTDEELGLKYLTACCLVFPSEYEGFGIPLLEAFAYGTPVICSDIPVFREVAGESAVFFEPHDANELAEKLRFLTKEENSLMYVQKGLNRLKQFSWAKAANQTLSVYKEVLS